MPLITLAPAVAVAVNIAAWGVCHAATGYAAHRVPRHRLERDVGILKRRRFEHDGRWYERLRIRRWKDALPEAGALFAGGVSKRHLVTDRSAGEPRRARLERFAVETRRAEWGHWAAAGCGPLFALWNTPAIAVVMVVYGFVVNAPFIAIQRYNRWRIGRVLDRTSGSSS